MTFRYRGGGHFERHCPCAPAALAMVAGVFFACSQVLAAPKPQTICGRVVTISCQSMTRVTSILLRPPGKEDLAFVDLVWDDAAQNADRFVDADLCATGVGTERLGSQHVRVDAVTQLRIVREPPTDAVRFGGDARRACSPGISMPTLRREVKPNYTAAALDEKIQGIAIVEAVILADGTVGDTRIVQSLDKKNGLDGEALRACSHWLFQPARLNGVAVPVIVTIEMTFRLK